jgi:hypothetical protein
VWNLRQVTFGFSFDNYYNTVRNAVESRYYTFSPLGLYFHSGHRLQYSLTDNFERLFEPFRIHEGISVPAGDYSFLEHSLSFQCPSNKPLSYTLGYDKGAFYSGSG